MVWTLADGKQAHNVMHGRYVGTYPGSVALADTLLTAFKSALTSSGLTTYIASTNSLSAVWLRDINSAGNSYQVSTGAAQAGTAAGQSLPNEMAICLTSRTSGAGPGKRGRIYIPGASIDALAAGNIILAAAVTNATAFGTTIRSNINANGLTMCLALPARNSYTGKTGTVHPPRAAQTLDITQVLCRDNHWDNQRRRGLR